MDASNDAVDRVETRQRRLQATNFRQRWAILALSIIALVCSFGWLSTSLDHTAQERNGRVGDCRSLAQADVLDDFSIIVSPRASDVDKDAAAERVSDRVLLRVKYQDCIDKG